MNLRLGLKCQRSVTSDPNADLFIYRLKFLRLPALGFSGGITVLSFKNLQLQCQICRGSIVIFLFSGKFDPVEKGSSNGAAFWISCPCWFHWAQYLLFISTSCVCPYKRLSQKYLQLFYYLHILSYYIHKLQCIFHATDQHKIFQNCEVEGNVCMVFKHFLQIVIWKVWPLFLFIQISTPGDWSSCTFLL